MPSSATKIAVSSRWGDRCATFSGQHLITVTSRARIEVNATQGTTTVTTMPASATRTRRGGTIPLADAPGGGGPSDEGPSEGPPRRRQRTLDYFLASSLASSTRSEISTMTERRVTRREWYGDNGEILIAEAEHSATSEADRRACCPIRPLARGEWIWSCTPVAQVALLSFPRWGRGTI